MSHAPAVGQGYGPRFENAGWALGAPALLFTREYTTSSVSDWNCMILWVGGQAFRSAFIRFFWCFWYVDVPDALPCRNSQFIVSPPGGVRGCGREVPGAGPEARPRGRDPPRGAEPGVRHVQGLLQPHDVITLRCHTPEVNAAPTGRLILESVNFTWLAPWAGSFKNPEMTKFAALCILFRTKSQWMSHNQSQSVLFCRFALFSQTASTILHICCFWYRIWKGDAESRLRSLKGEVYPARLLRYYKPSARRPFTCMKEVRIG